jgi:hypothetical protein
MHDEYIKNVGGIKNRIWDHVQVPTPVILLDEQIVVPEQKLNSSSHDVSKTNNVPVLAMLLALAF